MRVCGGDLSWIDLVFRGRPHLIGAAAIAGPTGSVLIDPGPSICLPALEQGLEREGLALDSVTHILLTHIHLDHAGATGVLVRRYPRIQVLVHQRGAPHMIDPTRLVASAARLYGEGVRELWGEMLPVPAANVRALAGGERIAVGAGHMEVTYTPGHASHHVSYFDPSSGCAFVGDTAGVRINDGEVVVPTPPPDIDLELWRQSLARIEEWRPHTLFLTHFGPITAIGAHLETLRRNMSWMAGLAAEVLTAAAADGSRTFVERVHRRWSAAMDETQLDAYRLVVPAEVLWLGLARHWSRGGAFERLQ